MMSKKLKGVLLIVMMMVSQQFREALSARRSFIYVEIQAKIDFSFLTKEETLEYFMDEYEITQNFDKESLKTLMPLQQQIQIYIQQLKKDIDDKPPNEAVINTYNYTLKNIFVLLLTRLIHSSCIQIIVEFFITKYETRCKVDELGKELGQLRNQFYELNSRRKADFMDGFKQIARDLKSIYQYLTYNIFLKLVEEINEPLLLLNLKDADLDLVDGLDPFSQGIEFNVRPYRKSWKQMKNLSGGEKTISSLALIFALHRFKPSPLNYIQQFNYMTLLCIAWTKQTLPLIIKMWLLQLNSSRKALKTLSFLLSQSLIQIISQSENERIVISLRSQMFEMSEKMFGIYKQHDSTKYLYLIPLEMRKLIQKAKEKRDKSIK